MNEMRTLVTDTAARLFAERCDKACIDAAEAGEWPADLWSVVEGAGLPLASVPDDLGGGGASVADHMAILRQAGRHAVPLPLAETFLAGRALAAAGREVPAGPLSVAPVEPGDSLSLHRAGGGWVLAGTARKVPWAAAAKIVALATDPDGVPMLALIDPARCTIKRGANMAGEPRDELAVDDLALDDADVAPAGTTGDAEAIWQLGALARSAMMAGALERVLELTMQYAGERVQFGRPIAKFQAVQQQIAALAGEVAAAGKAADEAAEASESNDAWIAIAVAKARVGEAAGIAAEIAHQVHGAMGFTHEHELNLHTRRLWSWRDEFGAEPYWQAALGRRLAAGGADNLWAFISGT